MSVAHCFSDKMWQPSRLCNTNHKERQESPQETYRPWLIKYSMCCPVLGGTLGGCPLAGVPPFWPGWGYPPSSPGQGDPRWVPPGWGTPNPYMAGGTLGEYPLVGVPSNWTWPGGTLGGWPPSWGTPSSPGWRGYPGQVPLAGVPPQLDLARVPPYLDLAGVAPPPPGLDLAEVPPCRCGLTNKVKIITSRLVLRTWSVKIEANCGWSVSNLGNCV